MEKYCFKHCGCTEEDVKFAVGSDHAGVAIRKEIAEFLKEKGHEVVEFGPAHKDEKTDYPDIARKVALGVTNGNFEMGVLICGTGIGMSIAANRFPGVRAALVLNEFMAEFAKRHNNANVIVFPGRVLTPAYCVRLLEVWLSASFEGGRHERRLKKIEEIERDLR